MATCSNCFSGCIQITPDKCIKYTGEDITSLGISNGDTLLTAEQNLISALLGALDGTGIVPTVDVGILCTLVSSYLPIGTSNLVDYIVALIKAVCDLQTQVTDNTNELATLNADYTISCLSGVTSASDTHDIVQAIITKLCSLDTSFTALVAALPTTYVSLADLNTLIQAYLTSISSGTAIKNKMVPYSAIPYFGSLSYFDATGAGTGDWDKVYLCNGQNSTPDLRGRVIVSVTDVVGGGAYGVAVDPGISGNPNYALNDNTHGANNVTLSAAQMPTHSHATAVTSTATAHYHEQFNNDINGTVINSTLYPVRSKDTQSNLEYQIEGTSTVASLGKTSSETVSISNVVTNPTAGSGDSHNNIQPVYAANFIIYIP